MGMIETKRSILVLAVAAAVLTAGIAAQSPSQDPSVSKAWVMVPPAADTSAKVFAVIDNPGMYELYVQSASSDAAASVEFHDGANGDKQVEWILIDAYGSLTMKPKGPYVQLVGLKKPLKEGDAVTITLVTDKATKILVSATVRKEEP
jgi:copper(I)-binding protein